MNDTHYTCVDVETTGLKPKDNEIIEIGAVKVHEGKIVDRFNTLVRPKGDIPEFVMKLTGINQKMVQKAPSFKEIYPDLFNFLGDSTFVAHNVEFDFNTINETLLRLKLPVLTHPHLDTQDLLLLYHPNLPSYKLGALARLFQLSSKTPHRALSDAEIVAKLLIKFQTSPPPHPIMIKEAARVLPESKEKLLLFLQQHSQFNLNNTMVDYKDYLRSKKSVRNTSHPPQKTHMNLK